MTDTEKAALEARIDELCAEVERLRQESQGVGLAAYELGRASLADENAKLREQGARLFDKTLELGTENDRLRELCIRFAEYLSKDRCEGCVVKRRCGNGDIDECWQRTEIRKVASELGVDDG